MKEVSKSTGVHFRDFFIYNKLKEGLRPSVISKQFYINKKTLQHSLTTLKRAGMIKKIGYGVWEILKDYNEKEVSKSTGVGRDNRRIFETSLTDTVRGHGLQFLLKLPSNLRNWDKREDIFIKQGIHFEPLFLGPIRSGQKIEFKGRKIWLTDKSIIVYEKSSYFADTAQEAKSYAIYEFKTLIKALEGLIGAQFSIKGNYVFKVTRQHYALVKNALAKQYDKEGKKLEVYTEAGLWFTIDNSFNLHEAETIHPSTADLDNKKVQDFFNGIKKYEGFTPEFLVNSLGQAVQANIHLDHNLKTHFEVLNGIKNAVADLTATIKELKEKGL